jgi:hypothetical protein
MRGPPAPTDPVGNVGARGAKNKDLGRVNSVLRGWTVNAPRKLRAEPVRMPKNLLLWASLLVSLVGFGLNRRRKSKFQIARFQRILVLT